MKIKLLIISLFVLIGVLAVFFVYSGFTILDKGVSNCFETISKFPLWLKIADGVLLGIFTISLVGAGLYDERFPQADEQGETWDF